MSHEKHVDGTEKYIAKRNINADKNSFTTQHNVVKETHI